MTQAFVPIGTEFQVGDKHSAATFLKLAEVNKISGVGWSRTMVDTTTLDTLGGYKTYLPTFRDGDVIQIAMNFTPANWNRLKEIFETQEEEEDSIDCRLVLKAGIVTKYTWEFQAFVQTLKLGDIDPGSKMSANVELKITGAPLESSSNPGS